MKKTGKTIALVLAILLVFVLYNSLYTVQPKQYVAVRQFGRIVNVVDTPGLKMKVPFIQTIQRISAATILYDIPASDVITKDKKSMISDNYVLWRVTNPTLYIQTLNAIEARAAERIEAAVYNSLKKIISGMTQDEIIAARGERLTQLITDDANADIQVYGIEIIQSQIKALDLPEDNKAAVLLILPVRSLSYRLKISKTFSLFTILIPNLVSVLRNFSGLTKPVSDKSVNLKAFNSKASSLELPFVFNANLFLSSFSNL